MHANENGADMPSWPMRLREGVSAWGLALGCIIGWGSFVMPGTTFLPKSGPAGTALGLAIAAAIIAVIVGNYAFLAKALPEERGSYHLVRRILGSDHGFLAAWSLVLAYLSLLWANATAFVLIGRYLLGDVFQWGFHYTLAGYDVYFGEVVVTIAIQTAFGLLVCFADRTATALRTIAAVGVVVAIMALFALPANPSSIEFMANPPFAPGDVPLRQVLGVVVLTPWLFVGFETVYHEPHSRLTSRGIACATSLAVVAGAAIYLLLALIAASGAPAGYGTWVDYVASLGNLQGFEGMPVLFNVRDKLGQTGVTLVAVAIVCTLSTSLLGFYRSAARIIQTMASDGLLPSALAKEKNGLPRNAVFAIMVMSLPIPLLGRTAVGWNADVSTLSVSIVYAYLSLCAFKTAQDRGRRRNRIAGAVGLVASVVIFFMLLVPNIFFESALATESYLMLSAWSLAGILYYWAMFRHDRENRFGHSPIMWIMMLFLLLFSTIVWTRLNAEGSFSQLGPHAAAQATQVLAASSLTQIAVVVVALIIMYNLFTTMIKRQKELDMKVIAAEESNKAKTSFLSNMSHDIRTPMNAIVGFTDLAIQTVDDTPKVREYLGKIKTSSDHLLSLINDVLEMSRVESGKIELQPAPVDLTDVLDGLETIITGQAEDKRQTLSVEARNVTDPVVLCDKLRLNQVLLNLVSNAVKYTPVGGDIAVSLVQAGPAEDGWASYEIHVKDNGIGMTPEFAERVFEAFEREKSRTVDGIQGTGLGMAITKRIIDLMGGTIEVDTALGEGTEFTARVRLEVAEAAAGEAGESREGRASRDGAGSGGGDAVPGGGAPTRAVDRPLRLLLVDDLEINREIATAILEMNDFLIEEASNGQEALEAVQGHEPGYFDAVLMDIQMPVMDGYEATSAIRALPDSVRAKVPIIAVTANAFDEDRRAAFDAGMDGHVAKPINVDELVRTLDDLLAT